MASSPAVPAVPDSQSTAPESLSSSTPPPPQPPVRPENPNVTTLKAAFPDVDAAVISAVLIASSNNLEKAFDGLLGMSDPNFTPDPPIISPPAPATSEEERQILADEQFARQLANSSSAYPASRRYQQDPSRHGREARHSAPPQQQDEEPERSFLDDDLPVLKENLIAGFNETKSKVNSFLSNLKNQVQARMEPDEQSHQQQQQYGQQQHQERRGSAYRDQKADLYHAQPRSSTQYDIDARTLDDDFGELQLQDNTLVDSDAIGMPSKTSRQSTEPAHSAGAAAAGPSRVTSSKSRWQPIQSTTLSSSAKKEKDSFALGDDDDE